MEPAERRQAVGWLISQRLIPVARACRAVGLSRSNWYRKTVDWAAKDAHVIDAINEVLDSRVRARWGFWKCDGWLDLKQRGINHKRLYRVYKAMGLNHRRRTKKLVPTRVCQPLATPAQVDHQWSTDFMQDSLYCGKGFPILNILASLNEVRELAHEWSECYNYERLTMLTTESLLYSSESD